MQNAWGQTVRIAPHENPAYLRIAFDWPNITAYRVTADVETQTVTVTFGTNANFTLPTVTTAAQIYITSLTQPADTQIQIQLLDNMTFRPFRFNNSIILDISPGNFEATAANFIPVTTQPQTAQATPTQAEDDLSPTNTPEILGAGQQNTATNNQQAAAQLGDDALTIADDAGNISSTESIESDLLQRPTDDLSDDLSLADVDFTNNNQTRGRRASSATFEIIEINTYTLQDDGGRLEFIFSSPPQYQAIANNNNIAVTFDRPFTSDDLKDIETSLKFSLGPARISENGRIFILPTTGRLAIAHRRIENRVIVDVLPQDRVNQFTQGDIPAEAIIAEEGSQQAASPNIIAGYQDLPSTTDLEQAREAAALEADANVFSSEGIDLEQLGNDEELGRNVVRIGRAPEYLRLIFDFVDDVQYLIEHKNQELQITFGQSQPIDISNIEFEEDEPFRNPRILQNQNTAIFVMGVPNNYNIRHFRSGAKVVIDLLPKEQIVAQRDDFPDAVVQGGSQRFTSLPFSFPKTTLSRRLETRVRDLPDALQTVTISLTENVATAFFPHGGYFWFVVDRELPINLNKIRENLLPLLLEVTQIEAPDATILRFLPARNVNSSIAQKGFNYILRFHDETYTPPESLAGHIQRDGKNNKFLLLSSRDVGKAVRFFDPTYSGQLLVGTFKSLGLANSRQRDFIEFSLLSTQQGIAVVPYAEGIDIIDTETGYIVNKESGLNVIQQKLEDEISARENPSNLAILNFPPLSYSTLPFLDTRTQLRKGVDYSLDSNARGDFHLSAATFYLGQRLASEAYGYIQIYESNPNNNTSILSFRLLKAATLLLMDRTDEAIEILSDDAFSSFEESVLWQGVAAAQKGEWDAAKLRFDRSIDFIRRYPIYLRNWVVNWQIETAFATEDLVVVQTWLDVLRLFTNRMNVYEYQRFLYYDGLFSLRKEDNLRAYQIWDQMTTLKPNNKWVVLSELERISHEINTGRLSPEDSLESLEHLRYIWRGDELELRVLRRLGQLYLDTGNVELGLNILRNAAAFFPENPAALLLTQEMLAVFRSVFLTDRNRANIDAQTSLKLLRDFRELLPIGNERVRIISSIADNLIEEQFFGNANELLEPLIAERLLTAQQKRFLIVKVGLLHIISENSEGTINVFETYRADIGIESSQESIDARRLYAKALIDLGQKESALDLIAGDLSLSADLLRRDIFWSSEDWHRAALTMQRLTGIPPGEDIFLENRQANYLISWLLSLQLSQQYDTLQQVATRFEASMQNSPLKRVFEYIRSTSSDDFSPDNVNELIRILAEQATNQTFLSEYRTRYFDQRI